MEALPSTWDSGHGVLDIEGVPGAFAAIPMGGEFCDYYLQRNGFCETFLNSALFPCKLGVARIAADSRIAVIHAFVIA